MKVREPQWLKSGGSFTPSRSILKGATGLTTPIAKIGNMKVRDLTEDQYWDAYNPDVIAQWQNLIATRPELTMDQINDFVIDHYNTRKALPSAYNPTGKAIYGSDVNRMQTNYHNTWGFGNTDNFWRFIKNYSNPASVRTDVRQQSGQQFVGDNYWGEETEHRRANYFNNEERANADAAVAPRGWHWIVDDRVVNDTRHGLNGRYFYRLAPIGQEGNFPGSEHSEIEGLGPKTTNEGVSTTNQGVSAGVAENPAQPTTENGPGAPFEGNRLTFNNAPAPAQPQKSFFTPPIENAVLAANAIIGAARKRDWLNQKVYPKVGYPWLMFKPGSDFAGNRILENQAGSLRNEGRHTANNTSTLERGMAAQLAYNQQAAAPILQEAQNTQKLTEQDKATELNIRNQNMTAQNNVWNQDSQINAAAMNNILINNAQYQAEKTAAEQAAMTKLSADWHKKLLDDNLNKYGLMAQKFKQEYSTGLQEGAQKIYDLTYYPERSNAYQRFVQSLLDYPEGAMPAALAALVDDTGMIDPNSPEFKAYVQQQWNNPTDPLAIQARNEYQSEIQNAQYAYNQQKLALDATYNSNMATIPVQVPNMPLINGSRISAGNNMSPIYTGQVSYRKQGGRVARFVDYAKLIRKQQDEYSKLQDRTSRRIYSDMNKELDRLSREELVLLRSVFK